MEIGNKNVEWSGNTSLEEKKIPITLLIDFILSPGEYLEELRLLYKEYPELKKRNR